MFLRRKFLPISKSVIPLVWLTGFYFLSRLPFLRAYPIFYDSFEYSAIAGKMQVDNFSSIVNSSHTPIHTFYFLAILLFKKIFFFLSANFNTLFVSLIFGYLSVIYWYLLVNKFFSRKNAFFASFLVMLFPYFFIANTNLLYESEQVFFQIVSLYFFLSGLGEEKPVKIILAGFLFGASLSLSVSGSAILLIFILLFWQKKSKKSLRPMFIFIFFSVISFAAYDLLLLRAPSSLLNKFQARFHELPSSFDGLPILIFRILRNIILQPIAILSLAGAFATLYGLFIILRKDIKRAFFYSFLFLPSLFLIQYWHLGLYGRLGIFIIFPASLVIVETFSQRIPRILLCLLLLLCLIPTALAQRKKPPIYRLYSLVEDLDKDKIALITSDYVRFLYQKNNFNLYIVGPNDDPAPVEGFIRKNLEAKKIVLIDSQGINYPYLQYDGDFFQILSKKNKSNRLRSLWQKFQIEIFKTDLKNSNIYFLQVKDKLL